METTIAENEILATLARIERFLITKIKEKEWLSKAEAMDELKCKSSKICKLRAEGKIEINSNAGPGKQVLYSLRSIRKYLANPDQL